ncbi:MAG: hypothetical protein K8T25_22130, partial [Planctomycetia bacterium]|nr:hypothetical protein [Planctomycetia bacterium]
MTATLTTPASPTTPGTVQQNPPQLDPAATCTLVEFCDWREANPRFDRELGLLSGVKILGVRSQNGRVYRPEALAAAVGLYEGAKVNVNHPKGHPRSPRDYQERIGSIRNVALRPGEGLFGDFHFNPRHALAEQLLWDATHAPENVGFSHNVEARVARHDDQVMVEAITRVHSVDLVADPATTAGLFEAAVDVPDLAGLLLRREQPTLADTLLTESRNEIARLTEANARLQSELAQLRTEAERTTATLAAAERR